MRSHVIDEMGVLLSDRVMVSLPPKVGASRCHSGILRKSTVLYSSLACTRMEYDEGLIRNQRWWQFEGAVGIHSEKGIVRRSVPVDQRVGESIICIQIGGLNFPIIVPRGLFSAMVRRGIEIDGTLLVY